MPSFKQLVRKAADNPLKAGAEQFVPGLRVQEYKKEQDQQDAFDAQQSSIRAQESADAATKAAQPWTLPRLGVAGAGPQIPNSTGPVSGSPGSTTATSPAPSLSLPAMPDPGQAPTSPAPSTYGATQWSPTQRTVDANTETVSSQLNNLLNSDSQYLQRARMRSSQAANERGLMNSTMALQAGEAAAIDAALPIAQADAGTYSNAAAQNNQILNQAGQFNAGQSTDADRFTASAKNEFAARDQTIQGQAYTQRLAAQLDSVRGERLAAITNQYEGVRQASQQATALIASMQDRIASVMQDPNITRENKQSIIDANMNSTKNALDLVAAINKVDFGQLLVFGNQPASQPFSKAPAPVFIQNPEQVGAAPVQRAPAI